MVKETSVVKLSAIMRSLYKIYPDLEDWDYQELYRRDKEGFDDETCKKRWLAIRAREIEKTTQAITSFIEMGFDERGALPDAYLKKLIKYYLVLMDAQKYNLNFQMANDDIFEGM